MKKLFAIVLLSVCTSPAWATWPAVGWKIFEGTALNIAGSAAYDWLSENLTEAKLAALQVEVNTMLQQVDSYAQAVTSPDAPPEVKPQPDELTRVKESLQAAQRLLAALDGRVTGLEAKIALLEGEVLAIQTNQHEYQKTTAGAEKTASAKPVDLQQAQALQFDVAYFYRTGGQGELKPLENGAVLQSGDHYKIVFTPKQDAYVYIYQTDASEQVWQLFPMQEMKGVVVNHVNPVKAGQTYTLPAEKKSFFLDTQIGEEVLYFVATAQPDEQLEAAYKALQEQRKQPASPQLQVVSRGVVGQIRSRGPGGIANDPSAQAKVKVETEDGQIFVLNQQQLLGLCGSERGCVNVLRFAHR